MIRIDDYGLKECRFQAALFEKSVTQLECSSKIFIRRFMYSDLAARLDSNGFLYESTGLAGAFNELDRQFGATDYGSLKFGTEEMYWIGYIYRYWAYTHGTSSRQLFKFIKPQELRNLYYPYHSLDPAQAIDRILDARGVTEEDEIARGVRILRAIRQRDAQRQASSQSGRASAQHVRS